MKLLSMLILGAAVSAAFAAGPPLDRFCSPFDGNGCEVLWEAPTNGLPATVKIFKVVPTKFSPETISNLLQLAELTSKDRKQPPRGGVFDDKNILCYGDRAETKHLLLLPSQGYIVLRREGATAALKDEVVGVPEVRDALNLALGLLPKIGIPRSEIATNQQRGLPVSLTETTDFYKDKATGQVVSNVISRAVSLTRQIDGIPVWGSAGVFAHFGNEAKLEELTVTWRAIEPLRECAVPTASEFLRAVKDGKTLIRDGERAAFKKLSITKVKLYYWESSGSERQTRVYPFAVLEAKTDFAEERSNVEIFVPFANDG